jgi:hypothetical protein
MDPNVFMAGSGGEITDVFEKVVMSPAESAIKAVDMCRQIRGHFIIVDCDGVGIGTYMELQKLPERYMNGITVIKFHGSAKADVLEMGRQVYVNQRAEAAFVARDRIRLGRAAINYKDKELLEDLREDFTIDDKPYIQLVDKEEIKETLGRSPGRGDCWKMLQWAFEQDTKDTTYRDEASQLPRYTVGDGDEDNRRSLPSYAIDS